MYRSSELARQHDLSRSMENNAMEMKYFFELYEAIDRLGPGSEKSTTDALKRLPELPDNASVLDVGCGCGVQTLVLAEQLSGPIVAVDNHQPFLDKLQQRLDQRGLSGQVTPQAASMLELPFADRSFDLIWSEGAIYIMGFTEGLRNWRHLLKPGGLLAVTEISWFQNDPPPEIVEYWKANYPAMQSIENNRKTIAACGYKLIDDFSLPASNWLEKYYRPLEKQVGKLREKYPTIRDAQAVCKLTEEEIGMYRKYGESYGYQFYLMEKG